MSTSPRVKAARQAKEKVRSDIAIIGRTDALQKHGYEGSIRRLQAARDAGADVGQLEGVTSKEMAQQAVRDMAPMPLLLNMVEQGATPVITTGEAKQMGFRLMISSFCVFGAGFRGDEGDTAEVKDGGGHWYSSGCWAEDNI